MDPQFPDTSDLTLCPACFQVRGPVSIRGVTCMQPCACDPPERGNDLLKAPGFDFPTYVELCRACGLVAIPSGSRWSSFFCPDCRSVIRLVDSAAGFALIPLGRHSTMNSISLSGTEAFDDAKVDEFAEKFRKFSLRIDLLDEWRRRIVARRLADLKLTGESRVPLDLFIRRSRELDLDGIRESTLRELLEFFEVPEGGITR